MSSKPLDCGISGSLPGDADNTENTPVDKIEPAKVRHTPIFGNSFILDVIEDSGMMNVEKSLNVYFLLSQVLLQKIPGEVAELGCYMGHTAVIIQKTIQQCKSDKLLHVFDSFEGLPPKDIKDGQTQFQGGWCATTSEQVISKCRKFEVPIPIMHPGWFEHTLERQLPRSIAFAHLDGDFYSSIMVSLEHIYPRLSPGAVVVIDDYFDPAVHPEIEKKLNSNTKNRQRNISYKLIDILPGVKRACDEFFADKPEKVEALISGHETHGYFRKK
ncbi:MAG: class I SAM-dependent methyltransferase [Deltaproteobacteria bacterium]|nr:class I SAM-dependent methyltransferase [Deltaproteobacteria bacterium]